MQYKKNILGFSVIELLAVIAVVSIIVAIGIPSLSYFSESAGLRVECDTLITTLKMAQQEAVSQQYNHIVRFDTDQNYWTLIREEPDTENPGVVTEFEVQNRELKKNIFIKGTTGLEDSQVEFVPFGSVVNAGSVILENKKGNQCVINISPAGFVKR
ncbi:prepilin-type N-terminal cleavage/methylation domain-containing protein [bacterium]|nr:MAG: prepilin-type N-terminal cleavage/methylation domain-containing protein [bacterium]